jgi:uncharacterized protein YqjF (DUF2071 family)
MDTKSQPIGTAPGVSRAGVFHPGVFLTAGWFDLVVLNYQVDPQILQARLPKGVELDLWNGHALVSVVGFMFLDTRVLGLPIPFHRNFEEINLRFYVKRIVNGEIRRGVTFVKELVPRAAIAAVARLLYNENYHSVPMSHQRRTSGDKVELSYEWKEAGRINSVRAETAGAPRPLVQDSLEEFILEHYWGYTAQRNGSTVEYRVEHPPWRVWQPSSYSLDCDVASVYGQEFAEVLKQNPVSAVVAEGSKIAVWRGVGI